MQPNWPTDLNFHFLYEIRFRIQHPVHEIKKKFENSLLFTGRKLKEKIEKNLSTQMGNTSLNNNSELMDNTIETKKTIITNQTNQSFNSIVKRNRNVDP